MTVFVNFFIKIFAFFLALLVFFVFLGFLLSFLGDSKLRNEFVFKEGDNSSLNKIVLLKLRGPILNEPIEILEYRLIGSINAIYVNEFKKTLGEIKIQKPKGIIISIDSPGGSVSATYNLYKTLENFKKNNRIKVFIHTNELLASGGYWFGLSSDKIYASYGAMIGNIGVRGPDWIYFNKPTLISNGIIGQTIQTKNEIKKYNTIAGKSKDIFDPFREPTKKEIKSLKKNVDNIYIDFVNTVSKKRSIEYDIIVNEIGAFIFDAKSAKENYLIDDIKNLDEVTMKLVKDLKLKTYQLIEKEKTKSFFEDILQASLILKYNIDSIKNSRICNIVNSYTNVIFLNRQYMNNC
tara:strand:- start:73 stop:1122 length:1050 start_codon:yes stop_codon:yes gene_type:complete